MQDGKEGTESTGTTTRWRRNGKPSDANGSKPESKPSKDEAKDYNKNKSCEIDLLLIQRRTYLLSAGIGDTNKEFNKYKGKIGLVLWSINMVIHFGFDFYESTTIFDESWATCIGLFLLTLVVCCFSMIKHSIPWFIKGVKRLKKDGHYPKTLRRVQLLVRFMPFAVIVFAVGAAVGQFGCYWADDALKVDFNPKNSTVIVVTDEVEILLNILRATSLVHIFYGFCSLLLFHMTVIFMLQSSMNEYNERMGKLFREVPISIGFSEAVNLFSARAKFVREGSNKSSIVLTTLLVACCTSFVLNAYNFLFLKKLAIYIWFALAPLIWAVVPLLGAAWVTKTYNKYKFVVVNAWVDIPDEHEIEAQAHEALHQSRARPKTPVKRMWGSIMRKMDRGTGNGAEQNVKKEEKVVKAEEQVKEIDNKNEQEAINEAKQSEPPTVAEPEQPKIMRRNSEVTLSFESRANKNQKLLKRSSEGMPQKGWDKTPTILFTDHDASPTSRHREMNQQPVKRHSNSSMTEVVVNDLIRQRENEGFKSSAEEITTQIPNHTTGEPSQENTGSSSLSSGEFRVGEKRTDDRTRNEVAKEHRGLLKKSNDVCIEIEAPGETDADVFPLNTPYEFARTSNPTFSRSDSSSSCPSPRPEGEAAHRITPEPNQDLEVTSFNVGDAHPEMTSSASDRFLKSSLAVPQSTEGGGVVGSQAKTGHFLTGMAKTFHKWRTKTKKKRHFNYEKYITYLESILPTVGFSVGGVIITWNGIYTFIVIMTFLVGVFAQEAFFGK